MADATLVFLVNGCSCDHFFGCRFNLNHIFHGQVLQEGSQRNQLRVRRCTGGMALPGTFPGEFLKCIIIHAGVLRTEAVARSGPTFLAPGAQVLTIATG